MMVGVAQRRRGAGDESRDEGRKSPGESRGTSGTDMKPLHSSIVQKSREKSRENRGTQQWDRRIHRTVRRYDPTRKSPDTRQFDWKARYHTAAQYERIKWCSA